MNDDSKRNRPRHIAIIMDGNGRWAKQRGRQRAAGHQAGFHTTREIVESCARRDIQVLTLFAFSSENWSRPATEVGALMELFLRGLKSEVGSLHKNNIRVSFIGERHSFSEKLQQQMTSAESLTVDNTGMQVFIAVSYGGRWDIASAAQSLAYKVKAGELDPADIDAELFAQNVSLAQVSDPDLFIRTGGEKRLSNYLLWQLAYTELYFTDVLYPDFNDAELDRALAFYEGRQRRFGQTGEQVTSNQC